MSLAVHYIRPPDQQHLAELEAALDSRIQLTTGEELVPHTAEILIAGRPKRHQVAAGEKLQALIVPWSGVPLETRELMTDFPQVSVHNLHHHAAAVAESAFSLLLAAAKQVVPFDRALRAGDWRPRYGPSPVRLLNGKTALILGYGAIGRRVARMCRAFEMRVLAVRRNPQSDRDPTADEIHQPHMLPDLLPRADALIICLPHTTETDGLIGEAELVRLPQNAILVNIGRGPIVDEAALYRALHDGRLLAAGVDVWYAYPPDENSRRYTRPSSYPFHELDNLVMSPHRAGWTSETNRLRMTHLARLLNAAACGEVMPNRVDLQAGY